MLLKLKLREDGLRLRQEWDGAAEKAASLSSRKRAAALEVAAGRLAQMKTDMLSEIYRMLVLCLGEPPVEFEWTRVTRTAGLSIRGYILRQDSTANT